MNLAVAEESLCGSMHSQFVPLGPCRERSSSESSFGMLFSLHPYDIAGEWSFCKGKLACK